MKKCLLSVLIVTGLSVPALSQAHKVDTLIEGAAFLGALVLTPEILKNNIFGYEKDTGVYFNILKKKNVTLLKSTPLLAMWAATLYGSGKRLLEKWKKLKKVNIKK